LSPSRNAAGFLFCLLQRSLSVRENSVNDFRGNLPIGMILALYQIGKQHLFLLPKLKKPAEDSAGDFFCVGREDQST